MSFLEEEVVTSQNVGYFLGLTFSLDKKEKKRKAFEKGTEVLNNNGWKNDSPHKLNFRHNIFFHVVELLF